MTYWLFVLPIPISRNLSLAFLPGRQLLRCRGFSSSAIDTQTISTVLRPDRDDDNDENIPRAYATLLRPVHRKCFPELQGVYRVYTTGPAKIYMAPVKYPLQLRACLPTSVSRGPLTKTPLTRGKHIAVLRSSDDRRLTTLRWPTTGFRLDQIALRGNSSAKKITEKRLRLETDKASRNENYELAFQATRAAHFHVRQSVSS